MSIYFKTLLMILICFFSFGSVSYASCSPPVASTPCASGGSASQGDSLSPSLGVGNPVHLVTGNKYLIVEDLNNEYGSAVGLELVRHYHSLNPQSTELGKGWFFSYNTRLYVSGGRVQILQADGRRVVFQKQDNRWVGTQYETGDLHQVTVDAGVTYEWLWRDGRRLFFDHHGFLIQIQDGLNRRLVITRYPSTSPFHGYIQQIDDAWGKRMTFTYNETGKLHSIHTPLGTYFYRVHDDRLMQVESPTDHGDRYTYGAHKLKGWMLIQRDLREHLTSDWTRVGQWAYDGQGRAHYVGWRTGLGQWNELRLDYRQRGLTKVRDTQGRETLFKWARYGMQDRLESVSGHGCPECYPVGSRWIYDKQGRLLSDNDASYQYDEQNRIVKIKQGADEIEIAWLNNTHLPTFMSIPSTIEPYKRQIFIDWTLSDQQTFHRPSVVKYIFWLPDTPPKRHEINQHFSWETLPDGQVHLVNVDTPIPFNLGMTHPHLQLNDLGLPQSLYTDVTGRDVMDYDHHGRLVKRRFADGLVWRFEYLEQGLSRWIVADQEVAQVIYQAQPPMTEIRNDLESITIEARTNKGVQRVRVQRFSPKLIYEDVFIRSNPTEGTHYLPEGGALHYEFHQGRLARIQWQDAKQHYREVLSVQHQDALLFGNRIQARWDIKSDHHDWGYYWPNTDDFFIFKRFISDTTTYDYQLDSFKQALSLRQTYAPGSSSVIQVTDQSLWTQQSWIQSPAQQRRMVWDKHSSLAWQAHSGMLVPNPWVRDRSGFPIRKHEDTYVYNKQRRLAQVLRRGEVIASYAYNAQGELIKQQTPHETRTFFYADHRLVAEGDELQRITRRYIYAGDALVGLIVYDQPQPLKLHDSRRTHFSSGGSQLYFVHSNHMGLPLMLTDEHRKIRWQASFDLFGAATQIEGDIVFPMRYPGQRYDDITGLTYHYQRWFDSAWGHYLEPDPLWPYAPSKLYGYAEGQAHRFVDPTGMILFAFDGTNNTPSSRTNVFLMSQLYRDDDRGRDGTVFYREGVGSGGSTGDALTGASGERIVDSQWNALMGYLKNHGSTNQVTQIDLVGFSRGAALARHFSNRLARHTEQGLFSYETKGRTIKACVNLRFIGLFDSVSQFGIMGTKNAAYQQSIDEQWGKVVHIVAAHETRSLFPVTLLNVASNTEEFALIGAHSDIGGGYAPAASDHQKKLNPPEDLSDVALNIMLARAADVGVQWSQMDRDLRYVDLAYIHSENGFVGAAMLPDRAVHDANNKPLYAWQNNSPTIGKDLRLRLETMIDRDAKYRIAKHVGMVKLDEYYAWLRNTVGVQMLNTP